MRLTGAPVDDASAADRRQSFAPGSTSRSSPRSRRWCSWPRPRSRAGRSSACSPSCSASVFVERDRRHKTGAVNAADRAAPRRRRSGAAVRRRHRGRRQPRAAVPHRADRRRAATRSPPNRDRRRKVWIQPLSIAYVSQQGIPLGRHLRPRAAWYGKMSLVPHIGGIVRTGAVDVVGHLGRAGRLRRRDRPQGAGPDAGNVDPQPDRRGPARSPPRAAAGRREPVPIWRRKGAKTGRRPASGHHIFVKNWNGLGEGPEAASRNEAQALRQILRLPDERLRFPSYGGSAGARGLRRDRRARGRRPRSSSTPATSARRRPRRSIPSSAACA